MKLCKSKTKSNFAFECQKMLRKTKECCHTVHELRQILGVVDDKINYITCVKRTFLQQISTRHIVGLSLLHCYIATHPIPFKIHLFSFKDVPILWQILKKLKTRGHIPLKSHFRSESIFYRNHLFILLKKYFLYMYK